MNALIVLSFIAFIAIAGYVYLMYFDKEPQKGKNPN